MISFSYSLEYALATGFAQRHPDYIEPPIDEKHEARSVELVTVEGCAYETNTATAVLITHNGREAWIPYVEIHGASELLADGTPGTLFIPRWLAEVRGLPHSD